MKGQLLKDRDCKVNCVTSKVKLLLVVDTEGQENTGYAKHDTRNKKTSNSLDGKMPAKTVMTEIGDIEVRTPREREGEFEPQIVKKDQNDLSGMESQNISMYDKGMSTRDIQGAITISGQFQLRSDPNREIYLVFCRFEPSESDESVETIVNELKVSGYSADILETELEKCGLKEGSAARLVDGKYPDSISQISYRVNLAAIAFEQHKEGRRSIEALIVRSELLEKI